MAASEARRVGPRVARGAFLNFRWGPGDELFVYGDVHRERTKPAPLSPRAAGGAHALRFDELVGARRKLACGLHATFMQLHGAMLEYAEAAVGAERPSLVYFSRAYRSSARSCVDELVREEASARSADNAERADELAAEIEQHEWADCILHLCEIFFLERSPHVTEALAHWMQLHVSEPPQLDALSSALVPEQQPGYWPAVQRLLLHGRLAEARQLLAAHTALRAHLAHASGGEGEVLALLDLLLENCPTLSGSDGLPSFRATWRVWQEDAARLEKRHGKALSDGALGALRILRGDEPTLASLCRQWYELVLAQLLYCQPHLRRTELEPLVNAAIAAYPAAEYSAHEYVLMAVMLDDPKHALDNVAGACGRGWLHCHLEGLLSHAGQVEPRPPGALGCTDHELSVIEYARSLGGSRGLWQLGVDYLRALPYEVAWPWVCALVRAEEPAPDAKAERLLDVCAAWQLDDAAASVCTQLVARKLRARMPAAALGWFARTPEPWRVRARHDAIARALVRACEDPAAPGEDGSAAPPAKALARALAGLGGTASLRSLPESSWLVGYCQLREGLEQLAQRKGLTGAHAAARAAGHGAGGGMDVDGAAAAPPVPAAPAEAAALEAEVRRLLLELCAASPAHGAAGASALPQRVQSQLLLEAHAAGMLEPRPAQPGGSVGLAMDEVYALIGCVHGLHAHDDSAQQPSGALQPVSRALCSALATVILERPQDDASGWAAI